MRSGPMVLDGTLDLEEIRIQGWLAGVRANVPDPIIDFIGDTAIHVNAWRRGRAAREHRTHRHWAAWRRELASDRQLEYLRRLLDGRLDLIPSRCTELGQHATGGLTKGWRGY